MYLTTSPFFTPAVRRRPALDGTFDRALDGARSFLRRRRPPRRGILDRRRLQLTVDLPGTPDEAVGVSVAGRTLTLTVAGRGRQHLDADACASPRHSTPSR